MHTKQCTQSILLYSLLCLSMIACTTDTVKQNNSENITEELPFINKAKTAFLNKDYVTAASLLQPLADNGNNQAQYTLGYMYYYGLGVEKDFEQALVLITKAANKNYSKAIIALQKITKHNSDIHHQPDTAQAVLSTAPAINQSTPEILDLTSVTKTKQKSSMISTQPQEAQETPVSQTADSMTTKTDTTWPPSHIMNAPIVVPATKDTPETSVKAPVKTTITQAIKETKTPEQDRSNPGIQWILQLPDEHYTIQVLSSINNDAVINFMKKKNLQPAAYFVNPVNNQKLYSVITGSYATLTEARARASQLQQTGIVSPWVRNVKDIKKLIRGRK